MKLCKLLSISLMGIGFVSSNLLSGAVCLDPPTIPVHTDNPILIQTLGDEEANGFLEQLRDPDFATIASFPSFRNETMIGYLNDATILILFRNAASDTLSFVCVTLDQITNFMSNNDFEETNFFSGHINFIVNALERAFPLLIE